MDVKLELALKLRRLRRAGRFVTRADFTDQVLSLLLS